MSDPILGTGRFTHTCLRCKLTFRDEARNTRFCTKLQPEKNCQKVYAKTKKSRRKEYTDNILFYRIKAQAHTLGRAVYTHLVAEGHRHWKCDEEGCVIVTIEELEIHHKSVDYLDNRPDNLGCLCKDHHAKEQSKLRKAECLLKPIKDIR